MIKIIKTAEPAGLKELRDQAIEDGVSENEAYDRLQGNLKRTVRQSLVNEQGSLCAYCMCRIPRSDVSNRIAPIIIEHFIARNPQDGRAIGQALDYSNLLAVCHGNKGPRGTRNHSDLTCDAHRGNIEFKKINPCDETTLTSIYYDVNGKIYAHDPDIQFDLVNTLNLNSATAPLVGERKTALEELIREIGGVNEEDLKAYCSALINGFEHESNPKTPYVGILIWYLKDLIDKIPASD